MRVLAFLLALLPALAFGQGVQYEPRVGGGTGNVFAPYPGRVSPIVSLVAWDKGGSADWGAGIPSPTIDCAATGTSASAALQCSGATPSFAGPAQTAAGSPWWYRGDAGVRPAIALNGSTDWWGLGDVADPAGSALWCGGFRPDSVTGDQMLFAKDTSGDDGWFIYRSSAQLKLYVYNAAGTPTAYTIGTVVAGSWFEFCVAYEYVGNGTSIIRANVNGTAASDVTNAVGPIKNTATALKIGARGNTAELLWAGGIRRLAYWDGPPTTATSAAALAAIVATQNGLAHDKPAGAVASCSRSDSTPCGPFSDSELFILGPGFCCIHAPTYQGWASGGAVAGGIEVYGVGQNALKESQTIATGTAATSPWLTVATGSDAPTFDDNAAVSPDGTTTADLVNFGATSGANQRSLLYQSFTGTAVPWTTSVWVRTVSGSGTLYISLINDAGNSATTVPCAVTTAWSRCFVTRTMAAETSALYIGPSTFAGYTPAQATVQPALSVYLWGAQLTPTAYPVPYRSTPGASSYTGTASTATTLTVPVSLTDPARWAIAWTGSAADWTPSANVGLWGIGVGGSANTALGALLSGGNPVVDTYDAAVGYRRGAATQAFVDGSQHAVLMGVNGSAHTISLDGAAAATTMTGTGTGIATLPSTLYVGAFSTTTQVNGLVSRLAQCRRASGCR